MTLLHGELPDLGDTSAYLKLMIDSRNGAIIGRIGFEHYIQDVGTIRGEGQIVNDAACDDDNSLSSYIRGEMEFDKFNDSSVKVSVTKFCYNDDDKRTWQFLATAENFPLADWLTLDSVKIEALGHKAGPYTSALSVDNQLLSKLSFQSPTYYL